MGNNSIREPLPTLSFTFESRNEILFKGDRLWRPRFLISVIDANDRSNRVKPVDIGQTLVNLGHHLETSPTITNDLLD
jgi:hypothetical protein